MVDFTHAQSSTSIHRCGFYHVTKHLELIFPLSIVLCPDPIPYPLLEMGSGHETTPTSATVAWGTHLRNREHQRNLLKNARMQ